MLTRKIAEKILENLKIISIVSLIKIFKIIVICVSQDLNMGHVDSLSVLYFFL